MPEDSTFFDVPDNVSGDSQILRPASSGAQDDRNLIHSSTNGWSEIWLIDKDGRFRAIKALKPSFRGQAKYESLLRKEYEIGYSLSHTAIREIYDFRNIQELGNCIEMEWVDGITLGEFLSKGQPDNATARKIVAQLCDALSYLHSKQIIHRDIKPSNILITHNGNYPKLIDFGLSDADSWSILKGPGGTASFAAPELLEGKPGDIRADIYSLGKVIALLLPKERRVVRKCLMADPGERFHDALEVKAAIGRGRWIRAAAVAVLSALVLFTGLSLADSLRPDGVLRQAQEPVEPQVLRPVQERDTTVTVDVGAIDELFRQATEMIDDAGSQ